MANSTIAATVGVTPVTVRSWRGRFASEGLAKFGQVRQGRGRKPGISADKVRGDRPPHPARKPSGEAYWSCMDEKTSIQALDHTQASLPMTKGRAGTVTSDDKRHGTTTLFAALNALDGTVIGTCMDKHRHQKFLTFLRTIDKEVPKGLAVHLILDNYATHKHKDVAAWLTKHPRFHLHFTPTSSSEVVPGLVDFEWRSPA